VAPFLSLLVLFLYRLKRINSQLIAKIIEGASF
jgi:hypothetical protein